MDRQTREGGGRQGLEAVCALCWSAGEGDPVHCTCSVRPARSKVSRMKCSRICTVDAYALQLAHVISAS
jgi:hypothetical protein